MADDTRKNKDSKGSTPPARSEEARRADAKAKADAQREATEEARRKRSDRIETLQTWFNGILALVGVLTLGALVWQVCAQLDALRLTRESNEIARLTSEATERAWVLVHDIPDLQDLEFGKRYDTPVTFKNTGGSPATYLFGCARHNYPW